MSVKPIERCGNIDPLYAKKCFQEKGLILLQEFKGNKNTIQIAYCIECYQYIEISLKNLNKFKGCMSCRGIPTKYTMENAYDPVLREGYTIIEIFSKNHKTHMIARCPIEHIYVCRIKDFFDAKRPYRCKQCHLDYINKCKFENESTSLNNKIRERFNNPVYIPTYMTDDPLFSLFLSGESVEIDHIISIKAFCDILIESKVLDNLLIKDSVISEFHDMANHRRNLQLLTPKQNRNKSCKYNKQIALKYIYENIKGDYLSDYLAKNLNLCEG